MQEPQASSAGLDPDSARGGPVGHIFNARATRAGVVGGGGLPGAIRRAPETLDELGAALREMAAAGARRVIIEGGDGTVREVLSQALDVWPEGEAPAFAIAPRGNTNLIARRAGAVRPATLARLAAAPDHTLRRRTLAVLNVERPGARALRGFILGAGAYETATKMAREEIAARHGPQVMFAVLRLLRSSALRAPRPIGFGPDAAAGAPLPRVLIGLSTLPGPLLYGMEPFWGEGAGAIRWLDIRADPPSLLRAAPFVAFGRPRRWMRDHYLSGRAESATLDPDGAFILDGERFETTGRVRITARERATFLSL